MPPIWPFAPFTLNYPVHNGGLFIIGTAIITAENTLIGNNVSSTGAVPGPDDCFGPLVSLDYNLIQKTTNCALSGTQTHNIYNQDPLLGPLPGNGPHQSRSRC